MPVRTYKSTDASAPVLTGETGKLNDLLQAILVDGYGAITAAGWTREFNDTGSKTMVWRPAAGPQHYLQSQDNGPGGATYREARWRGYETMSAYNTGSGPFPTSGQKTAGAICRKSNTLDTTARPWVCYADGATLNLIIASGDNGPAPYLYYFGKFNSWRASDAYASVIGANLVENDNNNYAGYNAQMWLMTSTNNSISCYAARSYTSAGSSVPLTLATNQDLVALNASYIIGASGATYPNPVDGGILLAPLYVRESALVRGTLRGLWNPGHAKPLLSNDTFSAVDGATTRDYEAQSIGQYGQVFVETSDTWDTP